MLAERLSPSKRTSGTGLRPIRNVVEPATIGEGPKGSLPGVASRAGRGRPYLRSWFPAFPMGFVCFAGVVCSYAPALQRVLPGKGRAASLISVVRAVSPLLQGT
jgi:hypothetical protein